MIDISWLELFFCAALALVIIGPKDMPKFFALAGQAFAKLRRMYSDMQGSIKQLQQEVEQVDGQAQTKTNWHQFVPDEIKHLPHDFTPGSLSAEEHQARRAARDEIARNCQQQADTRSTHTNPDEKNAVVTSQPAKAEGDTDNSKATY